MQYSLSPGRRDIFLIGLALLVVGSIFWPQRVEAERISDIRRTKHNLSAIGYTGGATRTVKADTEKELCVFCHTPHGSGVDPAIKAPLWNRTLSVTTYTGTYESTSLQANVNELRGGPGGTSKLCLSCHDGTIAVGSVSVLAGKLGGNTIAVSGTATGGVMPAGSGTSTGFTRNLGTDLSNDHPISFTYNADVAGLDGELRVPPYTSGSTLIVGDRHAGGSKPLLPLDDSKVQCASCHDPHIRDAAETSNIKFLRLNRFQKTPPVAENFTQANDIVCLACHNKGKKAWSESAHANSTDANEVYLSTAADLREFPSGAAPIKVWEAACLNCHDPHTVPGSRRLLREGTDSVVAAGQPKQGGNSATEQTCYQCHTTSGQSILSPTGNTVPDIMTDFTTGTIRMPIVTSAQPTTGTTEVHNIINADFQETQLTLGKGNLQNRHVECPDCHNPHRVMKKQVFDGSGAVAASTHPHDEKNTAPYPPMHNNLASGVLRGSWGVEPDNTNVVNWLDLPTYIVKKGDGGTGAVTGRAATYLTREYQVCLKCHSDYGYDDNRIYPVGNRPDLGSFDNGTPATTNANQLTQYTNQAMEFAASANDGLTGNDQGERPANCSGAACNHRSWHPVIWPTGRTLTARGGIGVGTMWLPPWNTVNTYVGNQTMYCSDCHGSATGNTTVIPNTGKPWGPHGSSKNFLLKGDWDANTGAGQSTGLCFKCHVMDRYTTENTTRSGFCCDKSTNLHGYHSKKLGNNMKCSRCHVAIPHGWKNKAFLVDLKVVGDEAGTNRPTTNGAFTQAPYYMDARLRITNWKRSGGWLEGDCGGIGWMKSNCN